MNKLGGQAAYVNEAHANPISVLGFTIVGGRIAALDLVATPARLRHLRIEF